MKHHEYDNSGMALPWPLLWLLDPAGAYWARRTPRTRGPVFRHAAIFGPDVPGGSRQATDEEIAALDAAFARHADEEDEAALNDLERRWGSELRAAARRLTEEGRVGFRIEDRSVDARIVRFWRGDSLLETSTTTPGSSAASCTRIGRRATPDDLVPHLAEAARG